MSPDPEGDSPASNDTFELTEEFDCDVTSELPLADRASGPAQTPATRIAPMAPAAAVAAGSVFCERYLLDQPLGNGGTSLISRARDLWREEADGSDPYLAIKRLRPELRDRPGSIARLRREFQQTRSLVHPNIVRFYDFDCDRGTWFIAMECLSGEALGQRLRRTEQTGLPPREALRIANACGAALGFAHDQGVTHGDVKPDNVFVTAGNEVRVLDFGAAPGPAPPASAGQAAVDRVAPAGKGLCKP
jgi:serine/threonine protein kinase